MPRTPWLRRGWVRVVVMHGGTLLLPSTMV